MNPLTCVITIGASGCGKSTWSAAVAAKHGMTIINMDDIRAELTGDASDQSKNDEVYETAIKRLKGELYEGRSAIWDATSPSPRSRKHVMMVADLYKAKIIGIYFDTNEIACQLRDSARDRKVGSAVIARQFAKLTPPTMAEGFDEIQVMHVDHPSYQPVLL